MKKAERIYWDSGCFICLLNRAEKERREICEDVMRHAESGEVEIVTSMWTVVEVIRPKRKLASYPPFPKWAAELFEKNKDGEGQFREIWEYYHRHTAPSERLTPTQIAEISKMFRWSWIKLALLDQRTAESAVKLARDHQMRSGDSVHVATAIAWKASKIHCWDRDFSNVTHLIPAGEPVSMSKQIALISDFKKPLLTE